MIGWMRPLLALVLMIAGPAWAGDIWVGSSDSGTVTFTDTPPASGSMEGFQVLFDDLDRDRPSNWASLDAAMLRRNMDNYDDVILRAANATKVPAELIKAVMLVESGMNPRARSPKGARGLMQLMPGTASDLGVADSYDPEQNVHGGARYLRRMLDTFGDNRRAIAAYNAGPGAVQRHGGIPPFRETKYYVEKVLKYYRYFQEKRPVRA